MHRNRILPYAAAVCALTVCSRSSASIVVGGSSLLTQAYADQLETWLGEGPIALTRIFTKQSGDDSLDFHAAVDGKGRTISVMEVLANSARSGDTGLATNNPAQIIGGYNPQSWHSAGGYNLTPADADRTAFLFNLTFSEIQRQSLTPGFLGQHQTVNSAFYGPTFGGGHDIGVTGNLTSGVTYNYSYGGTIGNNDILSDSLPNFHIGDMFGAIEVFTIAAAPASSPTPEPLSLLVWTGLALCGITFHRGREKRAANAAADLITARMSDRSPSLAD